MTLMKTGCKKMKNKKLSIKELKTAFSPKNPTVILIISSSKTTARRPPTPWCDFSPDLRTVPGVLLPPPGVPGPPDPAFFVSRLLKKLASTPSLVWPAEHKHTEVTEKKKNTRSNSPPWWSRVVATRQHVPDCGMALATLAAADRLLVLGEPVGALVVVSYKNTTIHFAHGRKEGGLSSEPKLDRK